MNKEAVLKHLNVIREALYSGQHSARKAAAQRAFEALCIDLGTVADQPAATALVGGPHRWLGRELVERLDLPHEQAPQCAPRPFLDPDATVTEAERGKR